jgi:hypothetical protein
MFELSSGELFVVAFVTIAVVTALWWPRLGATIAEFLAAGRERKRPSAAPPRNPGSNRPPSGESSRG